MVFCLRFVRCPFRDWESESAVSCRPAWNGLALGPCYVLHCDVVVLAWHLGFALVLDFVAMLCMLRKLGGVL